MTNHDSMKVGLRQLHVCSIFFYSHILLIPPVVCYYSSPNSHNLFTQSSCCTRGYAIYVLHHAEPNHLVPRATQHFWLSRSLSVHYQTSSAGVALRVLVLAVDKDILALCTLRRSQAWKPCIACLATITVHAYYYSRIVRYANLVL